MKKTEIPESVIELIKNKLNNSMPQAESLDKENIELQNQIDRLQERLNYNTKQMQTYLQSKQEMIQFLVKNGVDPR